MKIFVGAGEPSGDRILAALLQGLRAKLPEFELRGFGGPLSAARGLDSSAPFHELAVNGISDVLWNFPRLSFVYLRLRRELRRFRPDLVLLVDYPGMNVGLASWARRLGIPVQYVAPPQLWAYRDPARRLARLRRALRGASLQTLFPFEKEFYAPWDGMITSGHFFPVSAETGPRGDRLLLCPGSRRAVLRRNLPRWLNRLSAATRNVAVLVPPYLGDETRRLCRGFSAEVMTDPETAYARAARSLAFPGTITLELFLRGIPTEVWAIVDSLTLWAGRRTLLPPWIALPNLLLGKSVLPEWVGSPGDFSRRPPEMQSPEISPVDLGALREKMGAPQGVDIGVKACLELLGKK